MRTKKNVWTRRLVVIAATCAGVVALAAGPSSAAPAHQTATVSRHAVTAYSVDDGVWT